MNVHLHHIAYDAATLATLPPGCRLLDHLSNERSDWYEYWPIRRFLQTQPLHEDDWHGFFSPKFSAKTGLSPAQVVQAVRAAAPQADVVLFSPQPDMGAFFLNVYEQGETFDPGFIDACSGWLRHIGWDVPLRRLVMDTRQVVFSNYFVARPAFWREWLRVNETLFDVCEGGPGAVRMPLVAPTSYRGAVQRKVFVQERTASLLLTLQPRWRSVPVNPFRMAWSATPLSQGENRERAIVSDALKRAHRDLGFPCYLQAFAKLRAQLQAGAA